MTELYWHWPEFVFTAAGALTRLEIESTGALIQLDQVSVVAIRQPPHFSSGPESHTAFSGATVSFRVDVEGDEPLALQWFCNGEPIVGERQPSLVLTHVDRSRAGTYQCRAANPYGTNLSSIATLAILAPTSPIFLLHPQDANPTAGSYLSLSAVALGTPPLSMQWFKDGLALVGETNRSLIIAKFEPTQAGLYHVVVSNALESVRSLQAHVVEAPVTPDVGVLRFTNQRLPVGGVPDAPIYDTDGITPLQGAGFLAQLYVSSESEPLRPAGQPRPFLTGYMQGMISADVVFLPGVPASVGVRAQIRVWQAADGLSYEEARAVGGKTGESEILSVTTGPSNPPSPSLGLLVGLSSFNLHAGLPEFHGGLLELVSTGLDGTLTWSLFGQPGARYLVERRIDGAHWLPLVTLENVTGRVTFSDRPEPSRSVVLYRAQWLP